ncbi:hypothetical protein ACOXXX_13730 [Thalassococcus sp. BH17M4-6]|uniref:hypothetical protein n=1 Tax=Thalassococcus sp. BH17M4-6 TaxID=3413148 RepID=UPI003BC4EBE2
MAHDWIIDVLTDLREFAHANKLPELAAELDATSRIARREIASHTKGEAIGLRDINAALGRHSGTAGIG